MKCKGETQSGHRCTFDAKSGSDYCGMHDPADTAKRNRYAVGKNKTVKFEKPIESIDDMLKLMAVCSWQAAAGNFDTKVLSALGQACGVMLRLIEQRDLVVTMEKLEMLANKNPQHRRYLEVISNQ